MFPSYKHLDVLNMPAVTFFALLNEGYRVQHAEYQTLAYIALLPYMNEEVRSEWLKRLEWASSDPDDILNPSGKGSSPAEIKRFFNGK